MTRTPVIEWSLLHSWRLPSSLFLPGAYLLTSQLAPVPEPPKPNSQPWEHSMPLTRKLAPALHTLNPAGSHPKPGPTHQWASTSPGTPQVPQPAAPNPSPTQQQASSQSRSQGLAANWARATSKEYSTQQGSRSDLMERSKALQTSKR